MVQTFNLRYLFHFKTNYCNINSNKIIDMEIKEEEKKELFKDKKKNVIHSNSLSKSTKLFLGIPSISPNSIIQSHELEFYNLDTKFTFGMYQGKSVREVIGLNPTYLDWCALNIIPFYITDEAIEEIINIKSGLLSNKSREILHDKYLQWKESQQQ